MAPTPPPTAPQPSKVDALNTRPPASLAPTESIVQHKQNFLRALLTVLLPPQLHHHLHPPTFPTPHTMYTAMLSTPRKHLRTTILILLGLAAEYQQPGFLPRPTELSALLVGAPCAALLVCVGAALGEWADAETWGDVWEREVVRYWGDDGESVVEGSPVTGGGPVELGGREYTPTFGFDDVPQTSTTPTRSPPMQESEADTLTSTLANSLSSQTSPSPTPYTDTTSPLLAPSGLTTLLPPHLILPPPAPSQIHRSGLLGESPMPLANRFSSEHFSGEGFMRRNRVLGRMGRWSGHEKRELRKWLGEGEESGGGSVEDTDGRDGKKRRERMG